MKEGILHEIDRIKFTKNFRSATAEEWYVFLPSFKAPFTGGAAGKVIIHYDLLGNKEIFINTTIIFDDPELHKGAAHVLVYALHWSVKPILFYLSIQDKILIKLNINHEQRRKGRSNLKKERTATESEASLFGLDEEISLQSVNFATTENAFLNERIHEENPEELQ